MRFVGSSRQLKSTFGSFSFNTMLTNNVVKVSELVELGETGIAEHRCGACGGRVDPLINHSFDVAEA